jgi:hypothetical protein
MTQNTKIMQKQVLSRADSRVLSRPLPVPLKCKGHEQYHVDLNQSNSHFQILIFHYSHLQEGERAQEKLIMLEHKNNTKLFHL